MLFQTFSSQSSSNVTCQVSLPQVSALRGSIDRPSGVQPMVSAWLARACELVNFNW
jgi:hypothetical protein